MRKALVCLMVTGWCVLSAITQAGPGDATEFKKIKFDPLPVPDKQLLTVQVTDLEQSPEKMLQRGVRKVEILKIDAMTEVTTTETLVVQPGGQKQRYEFIAAFGCHLPRHHRVTGSSSSRLLEPQGPDGPHVRVDQQTGVDQDTGATYSWVQTVETCEDTTITIPTVRHAQTIVRLGKKTLYFRDELAIDNKH